MIKRRMLFSFKRPRTALSPHGSWVRVAHWTRLGVEAVLAMAVAGALAWAPALPGRTSGAAAVAAVPAPAPTAAMAMNLEPARLAAAAEINALAAVLGPHLAEREQISASVRSGQTLRDVLAHAGVAPSDFNPALVAMGDVFDARRLRAGQRVDLFLEHGGASSAQLVGLAFAPDVDRRIEIARQADGRYRARDIAVPLTRRVVRAQGSITESLYADAKRAGASDMVIADIANLLAYTVDFQREIRAGDQFDIVFEQFLDPAGEVVKTGDIEYVRFTPNGRELDYWSYTPPGADETAGFYDALGESAQRFLMKTPVNATRISSGFSVARRHPVLGYTRAHKGTDFAAPRGTPIYAAGDGVIERANRYGSFGNYVRIRHANGYQTIYGHLNGFARGIRAGAHVTQGEVIGYVGMTGTATGPHLHYEVHLNGQPINPMTIEAPTGRTLADEELAGFAVERARIDALRERALPAAAPVGDMLIAGEPTDHAALEAEPPSEG